jgi:ligand-binding sensor domain-containing protein
LNDSTYHPAGELYLATARGLYHKATGDNAWSKVEDTDFDLAELIGLLFTETNQGKLWINSTDGVFVYVIE